MAVYCELCYPTALHGVSFHPHENMVAFCAFGRSQPVHVYLYDRRGDAHVRLPALLGFFQPLEWKLNGVLTRLCALSRSVSTGDARRQVGVGGQQVGGQQGGLCGRQKLEDHAQPRHARHLRPGSLCPNHKTGHQDAERQGAAGFSACKYSTPRLPLTFQLL